MGRGIVIPFQQERRMELGCRGVAVALQKGWATTEGATCVLFEDSLTSASRKLAAIVSRARKQTVGQWLPGL